MAGDQISILFILRLKGVIKSTITSRKFKELKVFKEVEYALFWDNISRCLFVMCQDIYAPMRVLCESDQKTTAMDKLVYSVLQINHMLQKWLKDA